MKDRSPTKLNRVLIAPEGGEEAFYATMTRADEPTQTGDPLNKNTFLKDSTAALFDLDSSAVPDNVFSVLSRFHKNLGDEYVWEKVKEHTLYDAVVAHNNNEVYIIFDTKDDHDMECSIQYGDSIDVNKNIVNPKTVTFTRTNYSHVEDVLKDSFFRTVDGVLHYWDTSYGYPPASLVYEQDGYDSNYPYGCFIFWAIAECDIGDVERVNSITEYESHGFVNSPDPAAYPIEDEFKYLSLGRLGQRARIASGSYFGIGGGKKKLTFDFAPLIVFVDDAMILRPVLDGNSVYVDGGRIDTVIHYISIGF